MADVNSADDKAASDSGTAAGSDEKAAEAHEDRANEEKSS
jgi:hypothetical protein